MCSVDVIRRFVPKVLLVKSDIVYGSSWISNEEKTTYDKRKFVAAIEYSIEGNARKHAENS